MNRFFNFVLNLKNIFFVFVFLFSCQLPKNDIVTFDKGNYIVGFDSPKKVEFFGSGENKLVVLDSAKGIYVVDLSSAGLGGWNDINEKKFSPTSFFGIKKPVKATGFTLIPYDTNESSSYTFVPFDFVKKDQDVLFVLGYVTTSDPNAGKYINNSYYVCRLNLSSTAFDNPIPLDSFPVSETDTDVDLNNKGVDICCNDNGLFISGNTQFPIRSLRFSSSSIDDLYIPNGTNGDRKKVLIKDGSRKTIVPGAIAAANNNKLFLGSMNLTEIGIHQYDLELYEGAYLIQPNFKAEIKTDYFPVSLNINSGYLLASMFTKVSVFNVNNNSKVIDLNLGNENSASFSIYDGTDKLYFVLYNYRLKSNKYADYKYDMLFFRSGIKVFGEQGNELNNVNIDGVANSFVIKKVGANWYSFSVCQDKKYVIINKIK